MLKLNKSLTNDFLTKQRRFYSKTSNEATKINVDYLKAKLSKYNVPDYYEKSLKNHVNISRFKGRAAVLIPISIREETNSTYFTLSKRTDLMSSHKGEVCFLGGKRDEADKNDVETAYREAKEEANVDSSSLTFLAQLCPVISFQQLLVTPVLAYFDKTNYQPVLNSKEVEMLFDLPTQRFLSNQGHKGKTVSNESGKYHIHYFKDEINGKTVHTWGLTAFLAIVVSSLLHSRQPDFETLYGKNIDIENVNKGLEAFLLEKLAVSDSHFKNLKNKK